MAHSKAHLFREREQAAADLHKALAHPARIAILKTLSKRNECVCGEIVDGLPLAQSTVSQHLKELKAAGLITGEIEGPKSCYCVNWKAIDRLQATIEELVNELRRNRQQCC
ncbi:MAG: winged helix-turn-helix transcriptional regulator [Ignavibacteriales bacterium]|nr:winged helix-turn-helix transcriptional regulator [Ignavibacteriales bacterium]